MFYERTIICEMKSIFVLILKIIYNKHTHRSTEVIQQAIMEALQKRAEEKKAAQGAI